MSPKNITKEKELLNLKSSVRSTKNYWLSVDAKTIFICKQTAGSSSEQEIKISKKQFNQLIDWYIKDQKV